MVEKLVIEKLGNLLAHTSKYGLQAEAMSALILQLNPELTQEQLEQAIFAAYCEWDL